MKQSIEQQERLISDWFDGKCYLKITNAKDKELFYKYICCYDFRRFFNIGGGEDDIPQYYAWRYCVFLHHHCAEFTSLDNYYDGYCIPFDCVRDIISSSAEINHEMIVRLLKTNGWKQDDKT